MMQGIKGTKERTETVNFRCTPEEKARLYDEAKKRKLTLTELLIGSALGIALGNAVYDAVEGKKQ